MIRPKQAGFTAVELLITLFVAAAFLVAGYQLYSVIIKDSGQTRGEARASNVAYDYIRRYTSSATNPCTTSTPVNNATITVAGISAVTVTVAITCPYTSQTSLSKVEATVLYNTPQQTVKYATFVTGVGDGTATPITPTGLVVWWKFNGNASDSSGNNYNGTVNGASLTTGQNGATNKAYQFTAATQTITATIPVLTGTLTTSAWINPSSYPSERSTIIQGMNANSYYMSLNTDGSLQAYWASTSSPGYHSSGPGTIPLNTWSYVTVAWNGQDVNLYVNSQLKATVATGGIGPSATTLNVGAESAARQFLGSIDDVRIYNRALTPLEISGLYAEGAQ